MDETSSYDGADARDPATSPRRSARATTTAASGRARRGRAAAGRAGPATESVEHTSEKNRAGDAARRRPRITRRVNGARSRRTRREGVSVVSSGGYRRAAGKKT